MVRAVLVGLYVWYIYDYVVNIIKKYVLHAVDDWFLNVKGCVMQKHERWNDLMLHCECGQSDCHLCQWRHNVTTASRVAFWQTQPAIFTSAQCDEPANQSRTPIAAHSYHLHTAAVAPLRERVTRRGKKEQEWMVCLRQRVICVES